MFPIWILEPCNVCQKLGVVGQSRSPDGSLGQGPNRGPRGKLKGGSFSPSSTGPWPSLCYIQTPPQGSTLLCRKLAARHRVEHAPSCTSRCGAARANPENQNRSSPGRHQTTPSPPDTTQGLGCTPLWRTRTGSLCASTEHEAQQKNSEQLGLPAQQVRGPKRERSVKKMQTVSR